MACCASRRHARPEGPLRIGPASGMVGAQSARALKPKRCVLDVPAPIPGLWNTHQATHLGVTVVPITFEGLRELPGVLAAEPAPP